MSEIVLTSNMVNGTLLNFGKRYDNNLRVIFDQWLKLHLGSDALSIQKNLKRHLLYKVYIHCLYIKCTIMQESCLGTFFLFSLDYVVIWNVCLKISEHAFR